MAAFFFPNGVVRSMFFHMLINNFHGFPVPSGIRMMKVADTNTVRDVQMWGVLGTGIEIGIGSEIRISGGRIIGLANRHDGSIGIHVTGNNGGVHVDGTDVIGLGTGLLMDSSQSGGVSNREIIITHATFDSDGTGIAVADNSYVSIAGVWAASSDYDQIWVAPGLNNPTLVITGGTIFNGGAYGGVDCSIHCNGITVNSGKFSLSGVLIRYNQGRGIWVPNENVARYSVVGSQIYNNGVGYILSGSEFLITNNLCSNNKAPNEVDGSGALVNNNLGC